MKMRKQWGSWNIGYRIWDVRYWIWGRIKREVEGGRGQVVEEER
jgi:hypothetical protein